MATLPEVDVPFRMEAVEAAVRLRTDSPLMFSAGGCSRPERKFDNAGPCHDRALLAPGVVADDAAVFGSVAGAEVCGLLAAASSGVSG